MSECIFRIVITIEAVQPPQMVPAASTAAITVAPVSICCSSGQQPKPVQVTPKKKDPKSDRDHTADSAQTVKMSPVKKEVLAPVVQNSEEEEEGEEEEQRSPKVLPLEVRESGHKRKVVNSETRYLQDEEKEKERELLFLLRQSGERKHKLAHDRTKHAQQE